MRTLATGMNVVDAVAFSPNGKWIVVGGNNSAIEIWDGDAGQFVRSLTVQPGGVQSLALSPDGRRVAAGDDKVIDVLPAQ